MRAFPLSSFPFFLPSILAKTAFAAKWLLWGRDGKGEKQSIFVPSAAGSREREEKRDPNWISDAIREEGQKIFPLLTHFLWRVFLRRNEHVHTYSTIILEEMLRNLLETISEIWEASFLFAFCFSSLPDFLLPPPTQGREHNNTRENEILAFPNLSPKNAGDENEDDDDDDDLFSFPSR